MLTVSLALTISCEVDKCYEYSYDLDEKNPYEMDSAGSVFKSNYQGYRRSEYFAYEAKDEEENIYYNDGANLGRCYQTDDDACHCNNKGDKNGHYDDVYAQFAGTSNLYCHDFTTEWPLLGVYYQDFSEFVLEGLPARLVLH